MTANLRVMNLGRELIKLKAERDRLVAVIVEVQDSLQEEIIKSGVKSASFTDHDTEVRVTLVSPVSVRIDEARLKKTLGANIWKKVTDRHLSNKKLESLIVKGEVDPVMVATCSEEIPGKTYIKTTVKVTQDQGETE